jgi:hypothetical protein
MCTCVSMYTQFGIMKWTWGQLVASVLQHYWAVFGITVFVRSVDESEGALPEDGDCLWPVLGVGWLSWGLELKWQGEGGLGVGTSSTDTLAAGWASSCRLSFCFARFHLLGGLKALQLIPTVSVFSYDVKLIKYSVCWRCPTSVECVGPGRVKCTGRLTVTHRVKLSHFHSVLLWIRGETGCICKTSSVHVLMENDKYDIMVMAGYGYTV